MRQCIKCYEDKQEVMFHKRIRIDQFGVERTSYYNTCIECKNKNSKKRAKTRRNKRTGMIEKTYTQRVRLKKYGLTEDQFNELMISHDNCCAICKSPERLVIDHCHKTNKVRGILCHNCNVGLGHVKEDIDILKKLIQYLEDHNE